MDPAKREQKMQKKAGRRADQLWKLQQKAEDEERYFWSAVSRAEKTGSSSSKPVKQTEADLFARQGAAGINFAQYDAIPVTRGGSHKDATEKNTPAIVEFAELKDRKYKIPNFVAKNLFDPRRMGYTHPTPVQKHAIPLALCGLDVVACAQTGSGKTIAFLLPLVTAIHEAVTSWESSASAGESNGKKGKGKGKAASANLDSTPCRPAALVLAPTRELAIQIEQECEKLCFEAPPPKHASGAAPRWCVVTYGGANAKSQLELCAGGVAVMVATPGRLCDFLERDLISLAACRFLVLDEGDRMLDMGFEPQLRRIAERSELLTSAQGRQTMMFSATFAPQVQGIAKKYLQANFAKVEVGRVGSSLGAIEQSMLLMESPGNKKVKLAALLEVLKSEEGFPRVQRTIVFTNKKHVASWVKKALYQEWVSAEDIHGDRSQSQREAALAKFRAGECDVLVATDVAARGLDISDVAHVIQFDLPVSASDFDSYVHRIGRTGRAGKSGKSTLFFVPGFEAKVGNGDLMPDLKHIFNESGQKIPSWFEELSTGGKMAAKKPSQTSSKERAEPRPEPRAATKGAGKSGSSGGKKGKGSKGEKQEEPKQAGKGKARQNGWQDEEAWQGEGGWQGESGWHGEEAWPEKKESKKGKGKQAEGMMSEAQRKEAKGARKSEGKNGEKKGSGKGRQSEEPQNSKKGDGRKGKGDKGGGKASEPMSRGGKAYSPPAVRLPGARTDLAGGKGDNGKKGKGNKARAEADWNDDWRAR